MIKIHKVIDEKTLDYKRNIHNIKTSSTDVYLLDPKWSMKSNDNKR
jgi:hypothetical protein